jgi:hypothetical protein
LKYSPGFVTSNFKRVWLIALLALGSSIFSTARAAVTIASGSTDISVSLDPATGKYRISAQGPDWTFAGSLGSPANGVRKSRNRDGIGAYRQIGFTWHAGGVPLAGAIRVYPNQNLILFQYTYLNRTASPSVEFPKFSGIPQYLYRFSYRNEPFAPPQFELGQYGTPWLLFDRDANAMVISPASHFIIARMSGDGSRMIASGLNPELRAVPAGFTQRTLMAIGHGIRGTWDRWGLGLTRLAGKERPDNQADDALRYYGYWTDHGAIYYYKFDPKLGYAGTLKAVITRYRKEKIPVRYLQLDSWWYDKSYHGMQPGDLTGRWNAFGGLMRLHADASLFPEGLESFQQSVGLPLVTHSRWISRYSPYRKSYQVSGVAPIGAAWWNRIAAYLKQSGVVTYEQDWQSLIDQRSPAFHQTVNTGEEFYDHMASACKNNGLTMQYCMALPCDFLQGSRYGNLTTIRVSDDRFSRSRWRNFLYTSQLGFAIGAWPWTDVYLSHETDNLLLSDLSAGAVGTGDALGQEDKANILEAVRGDGVIVKPDVPIMPLDRMYVEDARGSHPTFIADTWTQDGSIRTFYVFAYSQSGKADEAVRFSPSELGGRGAVYVYDYFAHQGRRVPDAGVYSARLGSDGTGYYIVAPVAPNGIAFMGDSGKFASMGKERIASIAASRRALRAEVVFAAGEASVTLFGYAPAKPSVTVRNGHAGAVQFDRGTHQFSFEVSPDTSAAPATIHGTLERLVTVRIQR